MEESRTVSLQALINHNQNIISNVSKESAGRTWNYHVKNMEQSDLSAHPIQYEHERENAFVRTWHIGYNSLRPLTFTPDDFLFLLMQAAATYINANSEKVRSKYVSHKGKVLLIVTRPDFTLGQSNPWNEVFEEFRAKIKTHIGPDNSEKFRGDFSTTTNMMNSGYDVVLMDAMQSYFEYMTALGMLMMPEEKVVGIPSVTLLGTPQDWKNFYIKAMDLVEVLEDDIWKERIRIIVDKLSKIGSGDISNGEAAEFFNNFYSDDDHDNISGHITAFFPYNKDGRRISSDRISIEAFPSALARAPVIVMDGPARYDMFYNAGQVGLQQLGDGSISPLWGWAVTYVRDDRKASSNTIVQSQPNSVADIFSGFSNSNTITEVDNSNNIPEPLSLSSLLSGFSGNNRVIVNNKTSGYSILLDSNIQPPQVDPFFAQFLK